MDRIEKAVKSKILIVAGKPDWPDLLKNETELADLGFDEFLIDDLAEELEEIVQEQRPEGTVRSADLSPDITVGDTVAFVKTKISLEDFNM
jgi:hypothetical protein